MNRRFFILSSVAGLSVLLQAGCGRQDEITRYTVPKPHVLFETNHVERAETDRQDTQAPGSAANPPLTFETPDGWVAAPEEAGGITKAAFSVKQDKQEVRITVTDVTAAAGELLPNINRWRLEVGLKKPISQQELDREVKQIEVGGARGHYVDIVGAESPEGRQSILGVIVIHEGTAWFFKLKGDAELAEREKKRFEAFVQSVRFQSSRGAGHAK